MNELRSSRFAARLGDHRLMGVPGMALGADFGLPSSEPAR
jgi:hypothetical protein